MNKVIIGSVAVLLTFGAAACGSDKKSDSTTAATSVVAGTSATGDSTSGSSAGSAQLGAKQAAVLAKTEAQMKAADLTYDESCVSGLIAQLSDADADLILSAVPPATVTASPAGEAIGEKLLDCVSAPTTEAVATT